MVEAAHKPCTNGIAYNREHERRGPDDFADRTHSRAAVHNQYLHLKLHELTRELGKPGRNAIRIALVDDQVLPLDISELTQPESERLDVGQLARCASKVPDAPNSRGRLRKYGKRRD